MCWWKTCSWCPATGCCCAAPTTDRKSTRLNSSHLVISYAVFCLKKKTRFLTVSNIEQILLSVAILAIVAVGETLVVLTRNVDLSVGSMVGFTAFIVANLFKQQPGTNLVLAILLGCAVGLVLGAINGLIV